MEYEIEASLREMVVQLSEYWLGCLGAPVVWEVSEGGAA